MLGLHVGRYSGLWDLRGGPDTCRQVLWRSGVLCLSHIAWQTQALLAGLGAGRTR